MTDDRDGAIRRSEPGLPRRRFLRLSGALALGCLAQGLAAGLARGAGQPVAPSRVLSLYNTHTGESWRGVLPAPGQKPAWSLAAVDRILRDHRTGDVKSIDPQLLELLYRLASEFSTDEPFHVVSGYRSPRTNALLRQQGRGTARNSLHMAGQAVDISLPNTRLDELYRSALNLKGGGVGYYPGSGFIHVDVGRVRSW